MLDADTLLTADAALANRFVDGILFQDGQQIMGDSDEVWEKAGSKLNNMAADGLRQNLRAMYCYLNRDMAHKVRDMQHKAHAQKQETDTEAEAARLKIEKERFGG